MKIENKKIWYALLLSILMFVVFKAGIFIGNMQVVCEVCKPEDLNFSLFWQAHRALSDHFIDSNGVDEQDIVYGAISGMAAGLGDPYTGFFNPQQAKIFKENLNGSFSGIGVEIGVRNGRLTVIAPLKDTPAERAGLKTGDELLAIDGQSTFNMPIDEAVGIIRGERRTNVILSIMREGWTRPRDIAITRDTITIPSMDWEIKDGNTAYVRIYHFDRSLAKNFRTAAFSIANSGARSIVLDLRNNPGGYLDVSKEIAGWFLKPGQTVVIEDFGAKRERVEYRSEGNGLFSDWQIVVLVNQGTASASEILAGALRDNLGVMLVGEKSFGKGSVQEVFTLQDKESFLKITVARWLTPKGTSISKEGLSPDVEVVFTEEDLAHNRDPQLEKALEIIKDLH